MTLYKNVSHFLNNGTRKQKLDKLNDETKLPETREDGNWEKGTTLIMGDFILSGLRKHKMFHRRSFKVRCFPGARIADMKQPKLIIMHIGTNDPPFLTPGNIFQELKELLDFILISLHISTFYMLN